MSIAFFTIVALFFLVALIYSTAGLGGGSSYLAILALSTMDHLSIRPIALLCNIIVVGFSSLIFIKHKLIPFKKILPLVILSIPFAFIGGRFMIDERSYFLLLALCLLAAASILIYRYFKGISHSPENLSSPANAALGGGIGFISGLVGIGGGIFLAPVLHLIHWAPAKTITATASLFILVNSIAGLLGQLSLKTFSIDWGLVVPLMLAVFLGGQIGSRLTVFKLDSAKIRLVTAFLIAFVALRLLYKYL